jgi:DNA-binding SARP family transcriptional activator
MTFIAKSAMPIDPHSTTEHQVFNEAAKGGCTVFTAPPGYLITDGLLTALQRQGRRVLWVRLGPEDHDPGILLHSLIAAARRWQPNFGSPTVKLMRGQPGPVAGWSLAFVQLGEELDNLLSPPSALVLQDVNHLQRTRSTLELLGSHLLPRLADPVACILTSSSGLPSAALPPSIVRRSEHDLRLSGPVARQVLARAAPDLRGERLRQAVGLCQGQAALLAAVCAAWTALGSAVVERAISRSADAHELLKFLARAWLTTVDVDARRALTLATRLGYSHAALATVALGADWLTHGPWLQQLDDGWLRVRTVWKRPLDSVLGVKRFLGYDAIHRAADYLLEIGAVEQAVPLFLELRDAECMTRAIADEADRLMNLGQWETISEWLGRLPERALKARPWLVYHQAEIAAAQDRLQIAQRRFSTATSLFIARHEPEGACQSMLAESALAAGRMDLTRAHSRALAASVMADAAGLPLQQAWAAWQLGSLALVTEGRDDIAVNFGRAAQAAAQTGDPAMLDLTVEAERLTSQLQEVRRRREEHDQAHADLDAAEDAAAEHLVTHVDTAYERATTLIQAYGWSHTPMAFRLPAIQPDSQPSPRREGRTWWLRVCQMFAAGRDGAPSTARPTDGELPASAPELGRTFRALSDPHVVPPGRPASVDPTPVGGLRHPRESLRTTRGKQDDGHAPSLTAHLLGSMRLALNDISLDDWPLGRGRALFKYLLTHRDPWPPREVLMEAFWPGATPEAARNNLNVALHGLRRTLRTAGDIQVVVFKQGTYRLHADLRLWVDVDEFERRVRAGRQLETVEELAGAMSQYEVAAALYQGDFLADDPYEDWAFPTRERLRLAYLDTINRLSRLYFSQGRYAACTTLCQRIVERDPCREDAHRRLIRCYSRQGQPHLALRQYRICVEALRAELGVDPAWETIDLHQRINRRETL